MVVLDFPREASTLLWARYRSLVLGLLPDRRDSLMTIDRYSGCDSEAPRVSSPWALDSSRLNLLVMAGMVVRFLLVRDFVNSYSSAPANWDEQGVRIDRICLDTFQGSIRCLHLEPVTFSL